MLVCLGGALLPAGSAAGHGTASERPAVKSVTFEDATGEDPQGPDITSVTVSNDDTGLLTFRVAMPSHPALVEGMRFRIWIDSDHDRSTGLHMNGMDYFLLHDHGGTGLFRCSGTTCAGGATASTTLEFTYASGPQFRVLDADVGDTRRFRFAVEAATGIFVDPATRSFDFSTARFDDAPARGSSWIYALAIGPQRLLVQSVATTPAAPRQGVPFTVRAKVTRADTGAVLSSGRVRCTGRLEGARRLHVIRRGFFERRAVCVFGIPPDAAGEIFRGTMAISYVGTRVTRAFSARVRP